MSDREAWELQACAAQDRMRLAVAQNVATNGRLFCLILVAANAVAGDAFNMAYCAVPVGLAYLAEQTAGKARMACSRAAVLAGFAAAIFTFISAR